MAKNRKCICCSDKYSYCPDCSKVDALKPSWASEFCSQECMTIWTTATKYNLKKITKSEAKSVISALTLKPMEQYSKCVQRDLGVILAKEPKPKRGKKSVLPVLNETTTESVVKAEVKLLDPVEEATTIEEVTVATEVVPVEEIHAKSHEVVIEKEKE